MTTKQCDIELSNNALWGRRSQVSALFGTLSMGLLITSPLFMVFILVSLQDFNRSVLEARVGLL